MGVGAAAGLAHLRPLLSFFLLVFLALGCCFRESVAQSLPPHEVEALRNIDSKLKIGWNFDAEPCGGSRGWQAFITNEITRNVTCECNATTNICHVTHILLKSQNLTGVLPPDFAGLAYLQEIDLSLNNVNGTFPAEWASLPLVDLSLMGNRIAGHIPDEIGNVTTLESLVLDDNLFEGQIPRSIGKLTSLKRLLLSSNNFVGELPQELANLKNLTQFLIDATGISGKIPNFMGNWTHLEILYMQGTALEGPFPSIFQNMKNLTKLKIANLIGDGSFPPLQENNLIYLTLRNCSISGKLPEYIGQMTKLKNLDLSFNNLTGEIPSSFNALEFQINYMYLTNNMLSGSIPQWILSSRQYIDISYNSFTGSEPSRCQVGNINLFASFSSSKSNSINQCLRKNFPCSDEAKNYKLFINCGGQELQINGNEYDRDDGQQGMSTFFLSDDGTWAYSSTGDYMNNGRAKYIATNTSALKTANNSELYMSARLNPLSMRYYGLCLQNGNYTVKLHFAEIMLTDDQTFSSNGKRLFDVSIQGQYFLRDFNIVKEADGPGREIVKTFPATVVEYNTLEIHFQWAGKGTTVIPYRGVYGPLISAISVTPEFNPRLGKKKLSAGAIVGVVGIVAAVFFIALVLTLLGLYMRKSYPHTNEIKELKLQTGYFSLKQIKSATANFDVSNKIGEGGFGPVYKGILPDGCAIAVKRLSSVSRQGNREFLNEIGMISALQHPNLVKLLGCCIDGNQLLLIYEYMENNNLARVLFRSKEMPMNLEWQIRQKICLGVAQGLAFLHEESRLKVVHRDIKATNILLDKDFNAKISDFGLAKLNDDENTHISTRIAGTRGYMAPEYAMKGYLTVKADVYSFGVLLLEVVTGKSIAAYDFADEQMNLLDRAYALSQQGRLLQLIDPMLGSEYPKEEAQRMLDLALLCASQASADRPAMSEVVSALESGKPLRMKSTEHASSEGKDLKTWRPDHRGQSALMTEISADFTSTSSHDPSSMSATSFITSSST